MTEPEPLNALSPPPAVTVPVKKRRRPALACEECRRRKVRCDRTIPCSNCVRSKTVSCTYSPLHPPPSISRRANREGQFSPPYSTSASGSEVSSGTQAITEPPVLELAAPLESCASTPPLRPTAPPFFSRPSAVDVNSPVQERDSETSIIESLTGRIHQLEGQLVQAQLLHQRRQQHDEDVLRYLAEAPSGRHDRETLPTESKGVLSKTRFFGQSHWMNHADFVSLFFFFFFPSPFITLIRDKLTALSNSFP
jgi:hypothetical protein